MQEKYFIELRVDFADDDKNQIVLDLVRTKARELAAVTSMLNDGRKYDIAIYTDDLFEGRTKIEMLDGED